MGLIEKKPLLDYIGSMNMTDEISNEGYVELSNYIDGLPPAKPEIIACGDCKHWICHDKRCGYWNHGVEPIDWCCHAERRTDG